MQIQSLGQEDTVEKEMATHSSILAWKIPRTEESGRLQSMGSQRVGHDQATKQKHQWGWVCVCVCVIARWHTLLSPKILGRFMTDTASSVYLLKRYMMWKRKRKFLEVKLLHTCIKVTSALKILMVTWYWERSYNLCNAFDVLILCVISGF